MSFNEIFFLPSIRWLSGKRRGQNGRPIITACELVESPNFRKRFKGTTLLLHKHT